MAEHHVKLEITPRVVDLGDRVIQLHHVVSVGRQSVHPLRPAGLVVMAVGLGLIGMEAAMKGAVAFAPQAGGSLPLWIGFAALGIGLFLLLYVRRVLSIQTSDGRRAELATASDEAATDLIQRIRYAMEAAGSAAIVHRQSVPSSAAHGVGEAASQPHRSGHPTGKVPQEATGPSMSSPAAQMPAEQAGARTMPAGRVGAAYANGHAGGKGLAGGAASPEGASITDQALQAYRRAGGSTAPPKQREQAATPERRLAGPETSAPATAAEPFSLPASLPAGFARDDGAQDLHALMEHVRRADVQHKEALLDLLRVVEDHYRGRASREDALAHWRSFADYVVQYLGDVDGLIAHTERFGRHMLGR